MLYIGQVAVPTLSFRALCEMGVLEDVKMSEDGRRHGGGQLRVRKPLGAQTIHCQKTRRARQKGCEKSPRREDGRGREIAEMHPSSNQAMDGARKAQRGRHYWRNRTRRMRQRSLLRQLKGSRMELGNRPAQRWATSPIDGEARIEDGESLRIKDEMVDGTAERVATFAEELRWGGCKELEVEVADPLVPKEPGAEPDDVLACCESWLADLEKSGVALFGKEVELPDLTNFGGFELFDVKKEPWAGQTWGMSEV